MMPLKNIHAKTVVDHATVAPWTHHCQRRRLGTTIYATMVSLVHRRLCTANHAITTSLTPIQTSRH
jgi:hypothetical protein